MAVVERYVNPNSAGGDGTTDSLSGANAAYASLAAWSTAEATDLVTAGDSHIVHCDGGEDTSQVDFTSDGWTMGASNTLTIKVDEANRTPGKWDTSKYHLKTDLATTGDRIFRSTSNVFIAFEGLQVQLNWDGTNAGSSFIYNGVFPVSDGNILFDDCYLKRSGNNSTGNVIGISSRDGQLAVQVHNSILEGFNVSTSDEAVGLIDNNPSVDIYNCTFLGNATAIAADSNTKARNCIFQNCTTDISGTPHADTDYNLTDSASAPGSSGTNNVLSTTLTFEDAANDDYHLAAGDTAAQGVGIGPSSDADVPTTDIDGDTRSGSTTDIGMDLFTSSDTTAPTFTAGPSSDNVAQTSFEIDATLDEGGTIYGVVVADGASAPTSTEVKAGQASGGGAPLDSDSVAATASTEATLTFDTGLSAGTPYDAYIVAEDDETTPNLQSSPTKVDVTTASASTDQMMLYRRRR